MSLYVFTVVPLAILGSSAALVALGLDHLRNRSRRRLWWSAVVAIIAVALVSRFTHTVDLYRASSDRGDAGSGVFTYALIPSLLLMTGMIDLSRRGALAESRRWLRVLTSGAIGFIPLFFLRYGYAS